MGNRDKKKKKRNVWCGRHFNWSVTYFSRVRYIAFFLFYLFFIYKLLKEKKNAEKDTRYKSKRDKNLRSLISRHDLDKRILAAPHTHTHGGIFI